MAYSVYEDDYSQKVKAVAMKETPYNIKAYQNSSRNLAVFSELKRKVDLLLR